MGNRRFHIEIEGIRGTAEHLQEAHGLQPEQIDVDDVPGMIADHVVLHGGVVNDKGWFRWPENAG